MNIDKYINKHIIKNRLFSKNFSIITNKNLNNINYTIISGSSSIIIHPLFNDKYILIVRNINYILDVNGNPKQLENSSNKYDETISFNKIIILDKFFNSENEYFLETIYKNVPYIGIEDVRFFNFNNTIYYIGSYYDKLSSKIKIVSGIYNLNDHKLDTNIISPSFNTDNNWEKNWVFFNNNEELNVIYKWKPIYICKINYDNKKLDLIRENDNVPMFFKLFRGSTNGIEYDNKIWFIVHYLKKINNQKNSYMHVFIVFDKYMNLLGYSNPFKFNNCIVEYCIGMVLNKNTTNFIITYSLLDKTTNLFVLSYKYINSLILYI